MKKPGLLIIALIIALTGCTGNGEDQYIDGSGTIEATNVIVSAKTSGTIDNIVYDEGMLVNEEDTVLIIEHEILDIKLKQAAAAREMVEAHHSLVINGARKEDKAQAKAMLEQAKANYKLAQSDKNRMESLHESKTITEKQWDEIKTRFTVAEAQFNSAKENYDKILNISRPEDRKQAKANLDQAAAAVALIEKNIKDCYVTAPSSGYIVKQFFEKGESVMPGASLFKLSDLSNVDLVIYVPEAKLGLVKLGQRAEVEIDAFENRTFEGKVTYISPEAEFTPKNIQTKDERTKLVFAVKIEIPNPEFKLKAGLPADGRIIID